jgi:preprotein translocase subunit SecY
MPSQLQSMFPPTSDIGETLRKVSVYFVPDFTSWTGYIGALIYMGLIFVFTYFWNAMMYNVEDIANNLKKAGSYIPGIRPGKQTKDFLDRVVSNVTFVGALFLAVVALTQYVFPVIIPIQNLGLIGGTSLLIMVSVALETMRQIEASILIRQYEG